MCRRLLLIAIVACFTPDVAAQHRHRDEAFLPAHQAGAVILEYPGYTLAYNETHEQALWVAYELTREETHGILDRTNDFRADISVPTGSASLADYRGSGYDRGHLAPAADMKWSRAAMSASFLLSNMSPQLQGFNRGVWKRLESLVRVWAQQEGAVYVVTGPVLSPIDVIGPNDVTVPSAYYKVLLDVTEPDIKAIGFVLPHRASSRSLAVFAVPIDSVEHITGLDFFPVLDDTIEEALESAFDPNAWIWTTTAPAPPSRPSISESAPDGRTDVVTVYVTRAGKKYHRPDCRSLKKSKIRMPLDEARERYTACRVCRPPE